MATMEGGSQDSRSDSPAYLPGTATGPGQEHKLPSPPPPPAPVLQQAPKTRNNHQDGGHHKHGYLRAVRPLTRYKAYDPRNFPVKTVLWFTRDEIQTLKSFSGCNFFLFLVSSFLLIVMAVAAASGSYPFTMSEGVQVQKTFAGLLVFQLVISMIGYFGVQAENSCVIDVYIACNGILIVSDILVLALFSHFADPAVIKFFKSTILFQALTSLFILINCVLIWSAFVVELQIRSYGSVGAILKSVNSDPSVVAAPSTPVSLTHVDIESNTSSPSHPFDRRTNHSPPLFSPVVDGMEDERRTESRHAYDRV